MFNLEIDLKNYPENLAVTTRTAARGIIKINGKYLLIYSTVFNDYKFPGGGVLQGESIISALIREVLEETGYNVKPDSIVKAGMVLEKRHNPTNNSILHMENHYFHCEVDNTQYAQNLDEYEQKRNYIVAREELNHVIKHNSQLICNNKNIDFSPWLVRETKVMKYLEVKND